MALFINNYYDSIFSFYFFVSIENLKTYWTPYKKLFYLHFNNAPSHRKTGVSEFCKKNKLFILPHPPYSPDLAPSDFFLFGYIKEKCEGVEFTSPDELIEFIENIFSQISSEVFERVFLNWEERLKKCIQVNGNYF